MTQLLPFLNPARTGDMSDGRITIDASQAPGQPEPPALVEALATLVDAPGQFDAWVAWAASAAEAGHGTEARKAIQRQRIIAPDQAMSDFQWARLCEAEGDALGAIEALRRGSRLDDAEVFACQTALTSHLLPGEGYYDILARFHAWRRPALYLEIGVAGGGSIAQALPGTRVVGIDPAPRLRVPVKVIPTIIDETSDAFFAREDIASVLGPDPVSMAFIDGLHVFEAALRDFVNLERHCARDGIVFFHDCLPLDARTAQRQRLTQFWSGDVWRILPTLIRFRPDLGAFSIATAPTGLVVVAGLDPGSRVLERRFDEAVAYGLSLDLAEVMADRARRMRLVPNHWPTIERRAALCLGRV